MAELEHPQYKIKSLKYARGNIEKPEAFQTSQRALDWQTQNWTFWPPPKKVFGKTRVKPFVEMNTSPAVRHGGLGVVWLLGAQEILCEWKEEWIPPNIKKF